MTNSKLEAFAAQKGMSNQEFLEAVKTEFIGPKARWFKARFAIPGKHWHWPSVFLLSGWYGWRKMYKEAVLSGLWIGFAGVAVTTFTGVISEHFLHFARWVTVLWVIFLALSGIREFCRETVAKYGSFVNRKVQDIISASETPEEVLHRSSIAGGTSLLGVLVPVIPGIVGLFLGFMLIGLVVEVTGWDKSGGQTTASSDPPGVWVMKNIAGSAAGQVYRVLQTHTGTQDGIDLRVRIQCYNEGIQPANMIYLFALTDKPITAVLFRRHDETEIHQATGYAQGLQDQSRVIAQIEPVDVMNGDELTHNFGLAAALSLGVQLFDKDGSLDKAAAAYQRFIIDYYQKIFSSEALLVQLNFNDAQGQPQTISRAIDVRGAVANRSSFLDACGLKDPYR